MKVVATRAELAGARDGMAGRVAVVMTMGALHAGHVRLIQVAHERADCVLVTIFVNPLQFDAGEDLQRYPRDLDADLAICAAEGVDVVFAPDVDVIYPDEAAKTRVDAGELGARLEGAFRPSHFAGVLTVVAHLLELTRPHVAVFGEKDAQQLELIRRMVSERGCPIEVVPVEIVREADGLALSSRNRYLSPDQRRSALALSRALRAGAVGASEGATVALANARGVLGDANGVDVDYLEIVDDKTWCEPDEHTSAARILVAGRLGSTRLIDNVSVVLGTHHQPDHAAG
jgi:pantoate--beta-alanine ligase